MKILKVSSKSRPNLVAGSIVKILKENVRVEIRAIRRRSNKSSSKSDSNSKRIYSISRSGFNMYTSIHRSTSWRRN